MPLVLPSPTWQSAFVDLAREHAEVGEMRYELALLDFPRYLARLRANARAPRRRGWVRQYELWFERRGALVGTVRIRPAMHDALRDQIGHIGYTVRPSMRGRGLGTRMLGLALFEARALGLDAVCLTVAPDNRASIRVIERNGGRWDGTAANPRRRYWIAA